MIATVFWYTYYGQSSNLQRTGYFKLQVDIIRVKLTLYFRIVVFALLLIIGYGGRLVEFILHQINHHTARL